MITLKELIILLKTAIKVDEINEKRGDIAELMPAVSVMFEFDQKNIHHQYDLWQHSLHTVIHLPRNMEDDMLYLAALLHDIGKPTAQCRSNREGDTDMHYYGHQEKSNQIVRDVVVPELERKGTAISDIDKKRLMYYVAFHDDRVSKKLKHINRHMKVTDWKEFQNLMLLQVADAKAHIQTSFIREKIEICTALTGEEGEILYQRYYKEKMEKEACKTEEVIMKSDVPVRDVLTSTTVDYEVKLKKRSDLSPEDSLFIDVKLMELCNELGVYKHEDGITYSKIPPYPKLADIPTGIK